MTITVGAGGGSKIGSVSPFNVDDVGGLFENAGETWLRTGVVETDLASYPDAKQETIPEVRDDVFTLLPPDGVLLPVSAIIVCAANGLIYTIQLNTDVVREYDVSLVATGNTFTISGAGAIANWRTLTFDGTDFWLSGDKVMYRIPPAFGASTLTVPLLTIDENMGVAYRSTTGTLLVQGLNSIIWEYNLTGTLLNTYPAYSEGTSVKGLVEFAPGRIVGIDDSANEGLYVLDENLALKEYIPMNAGGSYFDTTFEPIAGEILLSLNNTTINKVKYDDVLISAAITYVGIASRETDVSTSLPMYVRIK